METDRRRPGGTGRRELGFAPAGARPVGDPEQEAAEADRFDFDMAFDPDDYLYFHGPHLTPERTARELALVRTVLGLRAGERVLDLACGYGRLAIPLAEMGQQVTGLDRNEVFLRIARREAARRGVDVELVQGDMRQLPWRDRFDAIFSVDTSFGYFADEDNLRVLMEARCALRPGGRFLLETQHLAFLLRHMVPFNVVERGDDVSIDAYRYDPLRGRLYVRRTVVRSGRVRRGRFFVRLYTVPELMQMLRQAGLEPEGCFDETGGILKADSRRLVLLARRPR